MNVLHVSVISQIENAKRMIDLSYLVLNLQPIKNECAKRSAGATLGLKGLNQMKGVCVCIVFSSLLGYYSFSIKSGFERVVIKEIQVCTVDARVNNLKEMVE